MPSEFEYNGFNSDNDLAKMFMDAYYNRINKTNKKVMKDKEFENITYSTEEKINILKAKIDIALEDGNKEKFMELSQEYNELVKC